MLDFNITFWLYVANKKKLVEVLFFFGKTSSFNDKKMEFLFSNVNAINFLQK